MGEVESVDTVVIVLSAVAFSCADQLAGIFHSECSFRPTCFEKNSTTWQRTTSVCDANSAFHQGGYREFVSQRISGVLCSWHAHWIRCLKMPVSMHWTHLTVSSWYVLLWWIQRCKDEYMLLRQLRQRVACQQVYFLPVDSHCCCSMCACCFMFSYGENNIFRFQGCVDASLVIANRKAPVLCAFPNTQQNEIMLFRHMVKS